MFFEQSLLALHRSSVRHAHPNTWEVVSGRVRKNEDLLAATRREIAEETKLVVDIHEHVVDAYDARYDSRTMRVNVFAARATERLVFLSEEHVEYRWVSLDEFTDICPFRRLVEAARRAHEVVKTKASTPE